MTPREVFEVELAAGTTGMVRGGERGANWAALIGAVLVLLIIWGVARYFVDDAEPQAPRDADLTAVRGSARPVLATRLSPHRSRRPCRLTATGGDSLVVVKDRFRNVIFTRLLTDGMSKRVKGESPLRVQAANGAVVDAEDRRARTWARWARRRPAKDRIGRRNPLTRVDAQRPRMQDIRVADRLTSSRSSRGWPARSYWLRSHEHSRNV